MSGHIPIRLVEPDQDPATLQRVAREVSKILTPNEQILYIAVQNVTALSVRKDAVVVTNNRIVGFSPGVLGRVSFKDYLWQDVYDVSMKQGVLSTQVSVKTPAGVFAIGAIDKEQAKRLYGIAQQLETEWREKRRIREMEEDRAKAGGVYMTAPSGGSSAEREDPVARLSKAKAMLEQGLISEIEYETLKAKVLSEF
jgi:hypothetical protein